MRGRITIRSYRVERRRAHVEPKKPFEQRDSLRRIRKIHVEMLLRRPSPPHLNHKLSSFALWNKTPKQGLPFRAL